ncbi:hypothetical protein [Polaromonas sp.]|uniref:hypothetical protein n=1 Tax=Polaromonas sp. TaxID=1869339 RepID=UPI003264CCED
MRFEIAGKAKAKLCNVKIQSHKMGQKHTVPAVALRIMATMSNTVLTQFDKLLKGFLYEKNGAAAAKQQVLDGVEVVSDMPQLREAGSKLGELHWKDEQTGSTLHIYQGVTGDGNIKLRDGKVHGFKLVPKEGGTTQVFFTFFTTDVDAEILGELAVLHQHDIDIELSAPEIVKDKPLLPDEPQEPTGAPGNVTKLQKPAAKDQLKNPLPVNADGSKNEGGGGDEVLTPEQALAASHATS